MPPATVAALIDAALNHWPAAPDLEITLEANPSSVEARALRRPSPPPASTASASACNRSTTAALRFLGRAHGVAAGLACPRHRAGSFRPRESST
jgi:oxygen-independent coproporphyrinogen-3 oxidase